MAVPVVASGGPDVPSELTACAVPVGLNSIVGAAPKATRGSRRLTVPSWFGSVTMLRSAAGYGYAVSAHRFDAVSCVAGAEGVPISSTVRNCPATGQLNRTRMMRLVDTALSRAC